MLSQNDLNIIDSVLEWVNQAPHNRGCSSEFAPQLCSCGKKAAAEDLMSLEGGDDD